MDYVVKDYPQNINTWSRIIQSILGPAYFNRYLVPHISTNAWSCIFRSYSKKIREENNISSLPFSGIGRTSREERVGNENQVEVDARNINGETPLVLAAREAKIDHVKLLIENQVGGLI